MHMLVCNVLDLVFPQGTQPALLCHVLLPSCYQVQQRTDVPELHKCLPL